jgi:DNA-binding GntR family transcriptional regulator
MFSMKFPMAQKGASNSLTGRVYVEFCLLIKTGKTPGDSRLVEATLAVGDQYGLSVGVR